MMGRRALPCLLCLASVCSLAAGPGGRQGGGGQGGCAVLREGDVLLMGGRAGAVFCPRNDAKFLQLRSRSSSVAPQLRACRSGGEAAMVGDTVYLVGGFDFDVLASVHALRFSPLHTVLAPCRPPAGEHNGGRDGSNPLVIPAETSMLRLRPANSWKTMPRLKTPRTRFGMCSLHGMLWVFGGADAEGVVLSSVEVFEPLANTWIRSAEAMPTARQGHGVVVVEGMIYVMGGADAEGLPLNVVEVYDPIKGTWHQEQPMRQKRERFGISVLDSCVFIAGGYGEVGQPVADVEVFDPSLPAGLIVYVQGERVQCTCLACRPRESNLSRSGERLWTDFIQKSSKQAHGHRCNACLTCPHPAQCILAGAVQHPCPALAQISDWSPRARHLC
jgi:hypothetical protein